MFAWTEGRRINMDILLDKLGTRKVKILELLISEDRYWRLDEIADRIKSSKKTVQLDMKMIQHDIAEWSTDEIKLDVSSRGSFLKKSNDFYMHKIYLSYIKAGIPYHLFDALFQEDIESLTYFAEDQHVSYTSFYKQIKELREWLDYYAISIVNNPPAFRGTEKQIRYCGMHIYWRVFKGLEWPFPTIDREPILEMIIAAEKVYGHTFNLIEREQTAYWAACAQVRILGGDLIDCVDEFQGIKEGNPLYKELEPLILNMFKEMPLSGDALSNEVDYIFSLFNIIPHQIETTEFVKDTVGFLKQNKLPSYQATELILDEFLKNLHTIGLKKDNLLLIESLSSIHYHAYLFKADSIRFYFSKFAYNERKYHRLFYKKFQPIAERLAKIPEVAPIFEQSEFLFNHYIPFIAPYLDWSYYEKIIRVQILTENGRYTEIKLGKDIINILPHRLEIVSSYQLEPAHEAEVDLIVTDCLITGIDTPVFICKIPPTMGDWTRLERYISDISMRE